MSTVEKQMHVSKYIYIFAQMFNGYIKNLNNASVETEKRSYSLTRVRDLVLYTSSILIFKVNTRFIKIYLPLQSGCNE